MERFTNKVSWNLVYKRELNCQYLPEYKKCTGYNFSATVTSLQAKVETLATTNALMKEDLSITRTSNDKIQAENRKLKGELEKLRKIEKKTECSTSAVSSSDTSGHQEKGEKRASFVQVKARIVIHLKESQFFFSFALFTAVSWHDYDLNVTAVNQSELFKQSK